MTHGDVDYPRPCVPRQVALPQRLSCGKVLVGEEQGGRVLHVSADERITKRHYIGVGRQGGPPLEGLHGEGR